MLKEYIQGVRSLSIIGMCKNAGKTTVLNKLIAELNESRVRLGLTSIGRDGESTDLVTRTAKPGIYVYEGTLVATAVDMFRLSDITREIIYSTGWPTPMGEVAVVRARSDGSVQLAGPSMTAQLSALVDVFSSFGADMTIIDGALSRKTLCATLGCIGGVATAGIFAALCGSISPLNGFNLPEAEELVLRASDRGLKISGLFVSGILIASLGAVMDVAMSISSACWELRELNPDLPRKALFRSGMNIGQDAMGTMANTLILAFAGSSLNTLLLFQIFDYPMIQIFNADSIAIEIIRGVAGTIGIILTVPLVALLSAEIMGPKKKA